MRAMDYGDSGSDSSNGLHGHGVARDGARLVAVPDHVRADFLGADCPAYGRLDVWNLIERHSPTAPVADPRWEWMTKAPGQFARPARSLNRTFESVHGPTVTSFLLSCQQLRCHQHRWPVRTIRA
jgi:hypothetical protein